MIKGNLPVVVVGSHTSSYVMRCRRLPTPGEYLIADSFEHILDGGKGSNQALALSRLGALPSFVAIIGNDEEGRFFTDYFSKNNVDLTYVTVSSSKPTAKGIAFVDDNGIPMGATIYGAISEMTVENIEHALPAIRSSRVLLTQLEIPVEVALYACRLSKENGLLTILNPAPADSLIGRTITNVDVLTPNEPEAKLLAGFNPDEDVPIEQVAEKLYSQTCVKMIVITLGERGAVLIDEKSIRKVACPRVEAIDTSGAGDCFNAALAIALGSKLSSDSAVDFALKTATLSVSQPQVWPSFPTLSKVLDTYGYIY